MNRSLLVILLVAAVLVLLSITERKDPAAPNNQSGLKNNLVSSAWRQEPMEGVELEENKTIKNYYVVLDGSGSMADRGCSGELTKSEASKLALAKFSSLLPTDAHIGLLTFDGLGIREVLPLGRHSKEEFIDKVRSSKPGGATPLQSAIAKAVQSLELQGQKQLGYGEYALIIVTDGEADRGQDPKQIVSYALDQTPIKVQTIGFCIGQKHSLNQPGRTSYQTAQNVDQLVEELSNVLAEAEQFDPAKFSQIP